MLTGSTVSTSKESYNFATEKLVEAAKALNFKDVIGFAQLGANLNATFSTKQATQVTPLQHLVQNIDSFISLAPVSVAVTVNSNFKGKAVAQKQVTGTMEKAVLKENPVELAKQILELQAKVDANFVEGQTTALLSAAQQYPLVQQVNITTAMREKKIILGQLITLLVEYGANENISDSASFKEGLFLTAKRLAGKDESFPVAQPRTMLHDAIASGIAKREERKVSALVH